MTFDMFAFRLGNEQCEFSQQGIECQQPTEILNKIYKFHFVTKSFTQVRNRQNIFSFIQFNKRTQTILYTQNWNVVRFLDGIDFSRLIESIRIEM